MPVISHSYYLRENYINNLLQKSVRKFNPGCVSVDRTHKLAFYIGSKTGVHQRNNTDAGVTRSHPC